MEGFSLNLSIVVLIVDYEDPSMKSWDAGLYLKFAEARTQPCIDLVQHITAEKPAYVVDLGCGPGNSTEVIARRFAGARIMGIDSSEAMLERARFDNPQFEFSFGDVADWRCENPCDIILANAVLQWLPHHEVLLPHLLKQLRPGGSLAVQMPCNFNSPNHQALRVIAARPQWAGKVEQRMVWVVNDPAWYYDLLAPLCQSMDIWVTEYQHEMDGPEALLEWSRGTALRPYTENLTEDEKRTFESEYLEEIRKGYPLRPNEKILLPFKRLFFVAVR